MSACAPLARCTSTRAACAVAFSAILIASPPVNAQCPVTTLLASDAEPGDLFGMDVALDGERVLVGSLLGDDARPNDADCNSGAAYLFRREPNGWVQEAKLVDANGECRDYYGGAVAIDGDRAAVHSDRGRTLELEDAGSVLMYERTSQGWQLDQELFAADAQAQDDFGAAIDIDGERVLVGSPYHEVDGWPTAGAAYVYLRTSSGWIEEARLTPTVSDPDQWFGDAVALCGDLALIGAPRDQHAGLYSGAAFLFRREAAGWIEVDKLESSFTATFHGFGDELRLTPDWAVVAAPHASQPLHYSGAVHLFAISAQGATEISILRSPEPLQEARFGYDLGFDGHSLVVGAPFDSSLGVIAGAAYAWELDALGTLHFLGRLRSGVDLPGDFAGSAVDVDQGQAIVGADGIDSAGAQAGGAHIYQLLSGARHHCACDALSACGNFDRIDGCRNSSGVAGRLGGCGSTSIARDDLVLRAGGLPPGQVAVAALAPGLGSGFLFGDGVLCLAGQSVGTAALRSRLDRWDRSSRLRAWVAGLWSDSLPTRRADRRRRELGVPGCVSRSRRAVRKRVERHARFVALVLPVGAPRSAVEPEMVAVTQRQKLTATPSVRLDVGVRSKSRNQACQCQVSPGCTANAPVGVGIAAVSIVSPARPSLPATWTSPA